MASPTAFLLAVTTALAVAGPEKEMVTSRIRDHFARMTAIRVRATERPVQTGGLWAEEPETSRPVYDPTFQREYDIWIDHPKQRCLITERKQDEGSQVTSTNQTFYDGRTYTHLDPLGRHGLTMKGASHVRPPDLGPLHAIGYCFPHTYRFSLADLLIGAANVAVEPSAASGKKEYLIQVNSLPEALRPPGWRAQTCRNAVVRIWVSIEPEVLIHRWALHLPLSGKPEIDHLLGRKIPCFALDGYSLFCGFVNCYDERRAPERQRARSITMPTRILFGNGINTLEARVQEFVVNPRSSEDTFRPRIPPGFTLTRAGETEEAPTSVTGGRAGTAAKVREITQEARQLLTTGESLQAQPTLLSKWSAALGCAATIVAGVALIFLARRRKA